MWAVADLAICVSDEPWENLVDDTVTTGPQRGAVVEVADITEFRDRLMLNFVGWPHDYFEAEAFRKVAPLSEWEHGQFEVDLAFDARDSRRLGRELAQ